MIDPTTTATIVAIVATFALVVVSTQTNRSRKLLEQKLKMAERRLERELQLARNERDGLLDALSDVFLIIDEADYINYANAAALRLFNTKNLSNRPIREAFLDARLSDALHKCLAAKGPYQTQISFTSESPMSESDETRQSQTWAIDSAPMTTHDGVSPATRIVMRDVTMEHQTEQIRKDFVANASHELRTPMAIIKGYLENLLDDGMLEDTDVSKRFLTIMRKHSDRISRIVEEMLIISRLESGKENGLSIKDFNLEECINDVIERLESMIRTQGAKVELSLSHDNMNLHGDRFYWTQVLFNLVENALKQNPRSGLHIQIGSNDSKTDQQIWISDNGVGIPSADLPHIFRRFYRVDKQHSQQAIKGTGLGLSIVKRAIEAHGGTISATSMPGQETKFLITLPKKN